MMLAVMLSALMSSLTSIFNSSSTIFAMDVWIHLRKRASELELMIVGRVFVIVLVVISIIWIPVLRGGNAQLYVYIQEISSFLQPPICCIFILALFWPRLNEKGAFVGLVTGMAVGVARFIAEYIYGKPGCGDTKSKDIPGIISDFHYLYFSAFLFVVTGTVAVVVSLLSKPIDKQCLHRLTFWSRHSKEPRKDIEGNFRQGEESHTMMDAEAQRHEMQLLHSDKRNPENIDDQLDTDNEQAKNGEVAHQINDTEEKSKQPIKTCCRSFVNWLCGMEYVEVTRIDKKQVTRQDMVCIEEDRRWKICSNVAAVCSMVAMVTIAIYFG